MPSQATIACVPSLYHHTPGAPVVTGITALVKVTAGRHEGKDIEKLPLYTAAPATYGYQSGTRAELGLPAAVPPVDPTSVVRTLVALTKTELRVAKGELVISFKALCTTCRRVGHTTKGCKRAARDSAHFYATHPVAARAHMRETRGEGGPSDRFEEMSEAGSSCMVPGWQNAGKRARN